MLEKYPEKVRLAYKNFPLSSHKFARPAAAAALSAGKQGKFWEFHDELYLNYNRLNEQKIADIAKTLGLDMGRFESGLSDPEILATINRDTREAVDLGIRGVPSVFINGQHIRKISLQTLEAMVEKELERKTGN